MTWEANLVVSPGFQAFFKSSGLLEFYYDDTQQLQSDMGDHGAKGAVFLTSFCFFFFGGGEGTWRFHPISFKVHLVKITPGFFSHEKAIWKGMYWDLLYNYLYTNWDDPPRRGAWFKGVPWWIGVFGYWTLSMLFPRVEGTSNLHFKGIWINFDWISYSINHVC